MDLQSRKKIRLPEYDYSQNGVYFITICTNKWENIFWEDWDATNRSGNEYKLSTYGDIAERSLREINKRYFNAGIDKYIVMPNHIHILLRINNDAERDGRLIAPTSISTIVQQYKSAFTKEAGIQIWQKSFYEHVIRNSKDYDDIWMYIHMNPEKWHEDRYNKNRTN